MSSSLLEPAFFPQRDGLALLTLHRPRCRFRVPTAIARKELIIAKRLLIFPSGSVITEGVTVVQVRIAHSTLRVLGHFVLISVLPARFQYAGTSVATTITVARKLIL